MSRRKRWLHRLYSRNCRQWERKLDKIECEYLKAKVACILFWDSTADASLEVRNNYPYYLLGLSRKWKPFYDLFYTEDDVMNALMQVAEYPKQGQNGAYKRSRKPKPQFRG